VGLSTRTGTPSTAPSVARARSARRNGGNPQRATSASASQKPALWRVAAYSGPGFPRPTTARRDQLSLPPLGFSVFSGFSPFSPLAGGAAPLAGAAAPFASGFAPPSAASPSASSSPSRTLRINSGAATSATASGVGAVTSSARGGPTVARVRSLRSEEHTSELQ